MQILESPRIIQKVQLFQSGLVVVALGIFLPTYKYSFNVFVLQMEVIRLSSNIFASLHYCAFHWFGWCISKFLYIEYMINWILDMFVILMQDGKLSCDMLFNTSFTSIVETFISYLFLQSVFYLFLLIFFNYIFM